MKKPLLALLRCYQAYISPMLGSNCRFYPSCSSYAMQAIETHGALKGSYMACKRLLRCQPFSKGGFDPVPEKTSSCCQPAAPTSSAKEAHHD